MWLVCAFINFADIFDILANEANAGEYKITYKFKRIIYVQGLHLFATDFEIEKLQNS